MNEKLDLHRLYVYLSNDQLTTNNNKQIIHLKFDNQRLLTGHGIHVTERFTVEMSLEEVFLIFHWHLTFVKCLDIF